MKLTPQASSSPSKFDVLHIGRSLARERLLTPNHPLQRTRSKRRAAEWKRWALPRNPITKGG